MAVGPGCPGCVGAWLPLLAGWEAGLGPCAKHGVVRQEVQNSSGCAAHVKTHTARVEGHGRGSSWKSWLLFLGSLPLGMFLWASLVWILVWGVLKPQCPPLLGGGQEVPGCPSRHLLVCSPGPGSPYLGREEDRSGSLPGCPGGPHVRGFLPR